jgi:hypothetical protein
VISAFAQDEKINISSEIRTLSIVDGGYKALKMKDDCYLIYTSQRTRINLKYSSKKIVSYLSFQDVRLWGDDNVFTTSGILGNSESLSLHQAWIKYQVNDLFKIKLGRQILSYDDQRILSSRGWNDYQITYDAFLLEYKTDLHRLHIGLSCNNDNKNNNFYPSEKFKLFDFMHYQYSQDKFLYSGIAVITGNTLTDTTTAVCYRGTYGVNVKYQSKYFNARLSAYYQHNLNSMVTNISAYCLSLFLEKRCTDKFNVGLGLDYVSGNDEVDGLSLDNRFDILYGRRHGYYGYLDYYSTIPEQGLQDYMIKMSYQAKKELVFFVDWHCFMLSANKYDIYNPYIKLNYQLGQEVDLKINWQLFDKGSINFGWSIYNTTNTFKQLKQVSGVDLHIQHFCYLMLSFKPSVCLTK